MAKTNISHCLSIVQGIWNIFMKLAETKAIHKDLWNSCSSLIT